MTSDVPTPDVHGAVNSNDTQRLDKCQDSIGERTFTEQVIDAAHHFGWTPFHLRDRESVHIVRGRGFPDLVLYRNCPDTGTYQLIVAELKRSRSYGPTDEQRAWLAALGSHIPTFTWRPEDWDQIDDLLREGPEPGRGGSWIDASTEGLRKHGRFPVNFNSVITCLAETIEAKEFDRGDHARLRRMSPQDPSVPIFWKLMARNGMPRNPDVRQWGLITHGIALMSQGGRLAHTPRVPVGKALYEGDGSRVPFYSEDRLATLLTARGPTFYRILARLFRMLGSAGCSFNWREMAWLILNESEHEDRSEEASLEVARAYYQAARRSQTSSDNN